MSATRAQSARRFRKAVARQRIIEALPNLQGRSLLSVSDLALGTGVAQSTVRRHLPDLIRDDYLRYTSYVGCYALGSKAWK